MSNRFEIAKEELSELVKIQLSDNKQTQLLQLHDGIDGLCKKLHVDASRGLSTNDISDIAARVSQFGRNELRPKPPKMFIQLMWESLQDPTLVILIISALISLALSFYHDESMMPSEEFLHASESKFEWIEGAAILTTVLVISLVSSFNHWSKEKQFQGLKTQIDSDQNVSVLRDAQINDLPVKEILVGDICHITYGNLIPADGLVIVSYDLKVDEACLTGETKLIKKDPTKPMLFSGTHVMEGGAKMLVTAVGLNSQTGRIMAMMGVTDENKPSETNITKEKEDVYESLIELKEAEKELRVNDTKVPKRQKQSVLQAKLKSLTLKTGYGGMVIAVLTISVLLIRFCISEYGHKGHTFHWSLFIKSLSKYFIIGITVLVVAVPEGLPLAVCIAFVYAVKQMMRDNNLVRHLDACETMGNATAICCDKTGTLTTNRMTVVQCYIDGHHYYTELPPQFSQISKQLRELISAAISINSNYASKLEKSVKPGEQLDTQLGNKTECALLAFVEKIGADYQHIRNKNPTSSFVHVYTFNSERKSMSTCVNHPTINGAYRLFSKGASEIILTKCKYIVTKEGSVRELTHAQYNEILQKVIEPMACEGLRTICVAYKDILTTRINWYEDEMKIISDMVCICICGIQDPVRAEVPLAIKKCKSAGIVVRMLTGDNVNTARSIARQCGIIDANEHFMVFEGKEFREKVTDANGEISQAKIDEIWPKLRVLARSSPEDKYVLVKHIINSKLNVNREVVAVTGDGTNDGPALKMADVGFAMGIQGTDVAKEASDIILTDDNFNSIVKAVMWGRNVYDSIAKFLQFQLTVNTVAVICAFVGACVVAESPLRAVQMLWVNLVMDALVSLALATETPTEHLLMRKPYGRSKALLSRIMIKNIFGHVVYQLAVIFTLLFTGPYFFDMDSGISDSNSFKPTQHFTMIFNAFVLMTLFNEINSRKLHGERNVLKGLFRNPFFCLTWLIALFLQFGSYAISCTSLSLDQWAWCLFFGFGSLIWGQIIITVPTRLHQNRQ